jgi:endonuclease YncB( thermonuclease family)
MKRIAARLICAVLFCANGLAHSAALRPGSGQEFTAKIIAVLDGDTVLVRRESGLVKIRLAEIDAPEVGHAGMGGQPPNSQKPQPFGITSKLSLSDMVLGKQVKVVSQAVDQYGRLVAHLSVNGLDVNAEQIRRGMAWEYSNFHSNQALISLQNEARQAPRGLWAQSNPTPPWEWRKQHPGTFFSKPNAAVSSDATPANTNTHNPGCGNKRRCSEMSSCEEAKYYFAQCGVKTLDGDGDGVPCEKLCAPAQ